MADIKPDQAAEKPLSFKENIPASPEKYAGRPEAAVEAERRKNLEQASRRVIEEIAALGQKPVVIAPTAVVNAPAARQKRIERTLSAGLEEIYLSMSAGQQKEFRRLGEETAGKISALLSRTRVKIGDLVKLIKKWLSIIPGVNKYFLEKEAKIRADEIIKMKNNL